MPVAVMHTTLVSKSKLGQIDSLQVLRAVAVTLVAWAHIDQWINMVGGGVIYRSKSLTIDGVFGIDIFFVLSGFIMAAILLRSDTNPGIGASWAFLKRRLIRIFPIYWLFAFIAACRMLRSQGRISLTLIHSALLFPPITVKLGMFLGLGWTLEFEMFFYYLISLLLLFTTRRTIPITILTLCSLVALGSAITPMDSIWTVFLNPMLLEFALGMVIARPLPAREKTRVGHLVSDPRDKSGRLAKCLPRQEQMDCRWSFDTTRSSPASEPGDSLPHYWSLVRCSGLRNSGVWRGVFQW
jgi:peptidoglycan/LPS O-acetylase OafA/YrhL